MWTVTLMSAVVLAFLLGRWVEHRACRIKLPQVDPRRTRVRLDTASGYPRVERVDVQAL